MKRLVSLTIAIMLSGITPIKAETLTRDMAFTMALEHNPRLNAAIAQKKMAEGERQQASLTPNPEATLEIENFGGDDELDGFSGAEITLGIEQEIEVSGKRGKRTEIADYGLQVTQQEVIADALALLAETDLAFTRLAISQERLALAEKRLALADETHETVKRRVNQAAASEIQHTKVDIEQAAARLDKSKAEAELIEAQNNLSSLLASTNSFIAKVDLKNLPALPDRQVLLDALESAPQIVAVEFAKMQAASQFDLAKAQAMPNPTFGLGVRRFNENDSTALIAGVTFPLPVFNRNQGNITQAKAGILEADAIAAQTHIELRRSAISAWEKLAAAYKEADVYQANIVPSAERAYKQASDGYSAGRFSFLDLLDAQRTLYEVQEARLNSLLTLHEAKAQTDFLMGVHQPLIQNIISPIEGDTK